MQNIFIFFLNFALVTQSADGLVLAGKAVSPTATKARLSLSQSNSSGAHAALAQQSRHGHHIEEIDPVVVRPGSNNGEVDQVKVSLRIMNFFGTALKKHTFAVDMVMSCQWIDPRVVELIPEGLDELSMAWSQALKLVWMPGIVVTNRDIEKYEIISASVLVRRSGEVLRVERARANIMMKYQLADYPFDTQHLTLKIASSKYMLDEVKLTPNVNASGVSENIWGLYHLEGWNVKTYETKDGVLQKSRGVLILDLKRGIGKYYEDHLLPSFIALMISWAVFYFPFANPFITPRLALSILALLTFTNLMVKSSKELPGAAPFNWNDLFNQQMQTLMFLTIVLNISSEIAFHHFKMEKLARTMNHEAKALMPTLSIVNVAIVLGSGAYQWMALGLATTLTKVTVFVAALCYVGWVLYKAKYVPEYSEEQPK